MAALSNQKVTKVIRRQAELPTGSGEIRITIFAAGSRGDIQPCIMLGKALLEEGFNLSMAAT